MVAAAIAVFLYSLVEDLTNFPLEGIISKSCIGADISKLCTLTAAASIGTNVA